MTLLTHEYAKTALLMLWLILQEMLQTFLARGVQVWGQPVQEVLDDGHLLIQQAASQDGPGLVSMLLEVYSC